MALFGKRPSPYYGKNRSSKQQKRQSIITLRHEGQSIRKMKNFVSLFLQVQPQKPSSATMNLALMRTATGRPRVNSAAEDELPASEMAAQINASEFK
jgi:hypothetical protein